MKDNPLVSVVMAVFNAEVYVNRAISSILAQTFQDFEIVVVNDGSTDGTRQLLSMFELRDQRIQVINRSKQGTVRSLNYACGLAQGKYIARMDADDISFPSRLQLQSAFLERNPNVAVLGGAIEVIDFQGRALYDVHYPLIHNEIFRVLPYRTCFAHSAVTMRRQAFLAVGKYRELYRHAEDYDLWLRISERY